MATTPVPIPQGAQLGEMPIPQGATFGNESTDKRKRGFLAGLASSVGLERDDSAPKPSLLSTVVNYATRANPMMMAADAARNLYRGGKLALRPTEELPENVRSTAGQAMYRTASALAPSVGVNPESIEERGAAEDRTGILGEIAVPTALALAAGARGLRGEAPQTITPEVQKIIRARNEMYQDFAQRQMQPKRAAPPASPFSGMMSSAPEQTSALVTRQPAPSLAVQPAGTSPVTSSGTGGATFVREVARPSRRLAVTGASQGSSFDLPSTVPDVQSAPGAGGEAWSMQRKLTPQLQEAASAGDPGAVAVMRRLNPNWRPVVLPRGSDIETPDISGLRNLAVLPEAEASTPREVMQQPVQTSRATPTETINLWQGLEQQPLPSPEEAARMRALMEAHMLEPGQDLGVIREQYRKTLEKKGRK